MITVVIPLYNKAKQIKQTLQSVQSQLFANYQVVVVNDGSTDESEIIVTDFLEANPGFSQQVRLINQNHLGVSSARNRGISESATEWVAFLDADDLWKKDYLQTLYALSVRYPFCNICATTYEIQKATGQTIPIILKKIQFSGQEGILDNYFQVACSSSPPLTSSSCMVRKTALQDIGGFPADIDSGEDLLTWARLALSSNIAYSRSVLAVFVKDELYMTQDQKQRKPQQNDPVGTELIRLYYLNRNKPCLKQYVGKWHKMRMRIFLSKSMKLKAWKEWQSFVKYDPLNYKAWLCLAELVSPIKLMK
jgi:glycosyltransferase involved in cell wall biosynthesis